ncbi:hypothetical protein [uncultured Psychroserpens sp.]|uniref:hypothetical protein n=1 Tax=uncultured Psychroserpens sp. TaxID=255436 RepID=UPI002609BA4B|nr:hypothetical protein [uncultured Psychroserpens sp.]
MKIKRILKISLGIIIFFTLPSLLLFGFVYLKYNEDLPIGVQGQAADNLVIKMLDALDHDAYKATDYIEFTFKKRHHYKWYKSENICEIYWKNIKVNLDLNNHDKSQVFIDNTIYNNTDAHGYIRKAEHFFNNDTFWLVAPYKVFDDGVNRSIVKTKDNNDALLVTYTSGGTTPGDSYLWHLDENGKPTSFQMWVDILPIKGLEASWEDWTTTKTGAILPTFHKLLVLGLEIDNIKTRTAAFETIEVKCITEQTEKPSRQSKELTSNTKTTCSFGNFVSIATANNNSQENDNLEYQLYRKVDDTLIAIKNSEMFNSNIKQIEQRINEETKAHYNYLKTIPSTQPCLNDFTLEYYSIDDMGITFDDSKNITFHINYSLSNACKSVKGSIHTSKLKDFEYYFHKKDLIVK